MLKSVRAIVMILLVVTLCAIMGYLTYLDKVTMDGKDFVMIVMVGMTFYFTKKRKDDTDGQS